MQRSTVQPPDWKALRREFPTLERWVYLDNARKSAAPRCQARAMEEYTRDVYEHAGAWAWAADNIAQARALLAGLLGAQPAEIAFTKNTTEGLNIAAHAFELQPGDNIVITELEHPANVGVWKHWQRRGVEIRCARARHGRLPLEAFLAEMDRRTRIVATAYVTYNNGFRVNLPQLAAACRERGIRLVVDGVQGVGVLAAPLSELGADLIAVGGHKALFGLTGSGIVYCRQELVDRIRTPFIREPLAAESAAARSGANPLDDPRFAHRFESGNPNFLGVHVLRRAAEFIRSIGLGHIEQRVRHLTGTCLARLRAAGLPTLTPQAWEERAHIVNVLVPDAAGTVVRLRERDRIVANVKDGALRLSVGFFNDEEDLEKAVHAIRREAGSRPVSML
jgi:selenocysteine lyase/cysteine desulfurase